MENVHSKNIRIAKNSIYMGLRMIFVLIITLYSTRLILNELGIEDYGIFNVVCGFVTMFTFLNSAMSNGIQRFYNFEYGKDGDAGLLRVYNNAIIIQFAIAFIILILAETIGLWYINQKMVFSFNRIRAANIIFQSSIISFIIIIIQVPFTALVIAKEKMNFYAIMSVINACLALLIVLAIRFSPIDKLVFYGILYTVIQFITFICYVVFCKRLITINLNRKANGEMLKSIVTFSGWNILGTFSNVMKEQGINVLLNLFGGPVINAARGIATQVNGGFQSLVSNLSVPVRPQVTQSYSQGNYKRVLELTFSVSKLSCILLYMFSLPVLLEIDYILYLWLGDKIPDHTDTFIIIVVLTSFLNNLNAAVSGIVHSSGKMKLYQITGSLLNLMALPIAFILLKNGHCFELALWSVFFCMILCQTASLIILKKIINFSIRQYFRLVILPFVIVILLSIGIPIIIHCSIQGNILRLILVSLSSLVFVSIVTYWIGLNKREKELCTSIFPILHSKRN